MRETLQEHGEYIISAVIDLDTTRLTVTREDISFNLTVTTRAWENLQKHPDRITQGLDTKYQEYVYQKRLTDKKAN